ncbi:hypothetical protein SFUMM280S_10925 [Streptomyces fumanus]
MRHRRHGGRLGLRRRDGVRVGDTLTVAFKGGRTAKLKVAAITDDDTAIDQGARYLSLTTLRKYLPADQIPPNSIMFAKAEEGQQDQAYAALKNSLDAYPQYQVRDQTDYKQELKDQIGQMLNMVWACSPWRSSSRCWAW